jgi:hypothetical protein
VNTVKLKRDTRPSIAEIILASRVKSPEEVSRVISAVHLGAGTNDVTEAERDADSLVRDFAVKLLRGDFMAAQAICDPIYRAFCCLWANRELSRSRL